MLKSFVLPELNLAFLNQKQVPTGILIQVLLFLRFALLKAVRSSFDDLKFKIFQGYSLFSYQCSLLLFPTACIFYHIFKSLSTFFYFSLLSLKRDNSDILSCLSLFVNNFFHHHNHQPSLSFLPVPVSVSSSRVSLDIISRRQPKVNKNFTFYLQKYKHHKILFPGCLQTTIQS